MSARMPWLAAALARLPSLLLLIFSLSPLVWSVTRRRPMRIARVLTQLLGELSQSLLQLSDAHILRGDAHGLLGDARILRRELCLELGDPIVSPIALHDPPMIELRPDGKPFRIYGAKWITYAAAPAPPARLPAQGAERLLLRGGRPGLFLRQRPGGL